MKRILLGFTLVLAAAAASAAELPTMKPAPDAPRKSCTVGGMAGFLIPGTGACVKIGGYVAVGAEAGNVRTQYNWAGAPHD
jgi:Porin subfamily